MQINRLFEIVYILLHKKGSTAKELAEHFEVSVRTVLRDIDTLSAAGIPIYTTQGKGGGIFLLDNYVLNKSIISEQEQDQILFALQSISSTNIGETDKILDRMRMLFHKQEPEWIEVDFSRWGFGYHDKQRFAMLKECILQKKAIGFTYCSSYGETTQREVYPIKLIFKSSDWYLQGFCLTKQEYRTFKLNRMLSAAALGKTFAQVVLAAPEIDIIAEPYTTEQIPVELRFSAAAAFRVYDEFNSASIDVTEDGFFVVCATLPSDTWLYSYLLSFGSLVQVVAPQIVREQLLKHVEEIKNQYLSSET